MYIINITQYTCTSYFIHYTYLHNIRVHRTLYIILIYTIYVYIVLYTLYLFTQYTCTSYFIHYTYLDYVKKHFTVLSSAKYSVHCTVYRQDRRPRKWNGKVRTVLTLPYLIGLYLNNVNPIHEALNIT